MPSSTLLWYDLETTGTDARGDRILQLAAQRTDLDLRPVGEPVNLFCKPDPDVLPSVDACMVTGLDPGRLEREGLTPPTFVRAMLEHLLQPGTCAVGYNSLRFDDEFVRHTLWRHLHDPYSREWRNGNSRWDLLGLARLCRALRPDALRWPLTEEGFASLRLEELAAANDLVHDRAHDALSDVEATVGLARRIREAEPRLFAYALSLRSKWEARRRLQVDDPAPVLHVDPAWGRERDGLTAVLALGGMAGHANAVLVVDLTRDPRELLDCPDDALHDLLFPAWGGPDRPPVRKVRLNGCPPVAPVGVLTGDVAQRLDLARCEAHAAQLLPHRDRLLARLQAAFDARVFPGDEVDDPERKLYDGFIPDADRDRCARLHSDGPDALAPSDLEDPRLAELLFRYRARYHPDLLGAEEQTRWVELLRQRLVDGVGGNGIALHAYFADLDRWRSRTDLSADDGALLDALERFGHARQATLKRLGVLS